MREGSNAGLKITSRAADLDRAGFLTLSVLCCASMVESMEAPPAATSTWRKCCQHAHTQSCISTAALPGPQAWTMRDSWACRGAARRGAWRVWRRWPWIRRCASAPSRPAAPLRARWWHDRLGPRHARPHSLGRLVLPALTGQRRTACMLGYCPWFRLSSGFAVQTPVLPSHASILPLAVRYSVSQSLQHMQLSLLQRRVPPSLLAPQTNALHESLLPNCGLRLLAPHPAYIMYTSG